MKLMPKLSEIKEYLKTMDFDIDTKQTVVLKIILDMQFAISTKIKNDSKRLRRQKHIYRIMVKVMTNVKEKEFLQVY